MASDDDDRDLKASVTKSKITIDLHPGQNAYQHKNIAHLRTLRSTRAAFAEHHILESMEGGTSPRMALIVDYDLSAIPGDPSSASYQTT